MNPFIQSRMASAEASHELKQSIQSVIEKGRAAGFEPDDLAQLIREQSAPEVPSFAPAKPLKPETVSTIVAIAIIGLVAFLALFWSNTSIHLRIIVTLGFGSVMHIMSMMAWQRPSYASMGSVLFPVAVLFEAAGWWVLLAHLFPAATSGTTLPIITLLIMTIQETGVFRLYQKTLILNTILLLLYAVLLLSLIALSAHAIIILLTIGASMIALSVGMCRTIHESHTLFWQCLGAIIFYTACFKWVKNTPTEIYYLILVLSGIWAGARYRLSGILWMSAIAMAAYMIYFATAYILLTSVWEFSLVILAIMCFALAALARRCWRYYDPKRKLMPQ